MRGGWTEVCAMGLLRACEWEKKGCVSDKEENGKEVRAPSLHLIDLPLS